MRFEVGHEHEYRAIYLFRTSLGNKGHLLTFICSTHLYFSIRQQELVFNLVECVRKLSMMKAYFVNKILLMMLQ
jgi:hypothetical protein